MIEAASRTAAVRFCFPRLTPQMTSVPKNILRSVQGTTTVGPVALPGKRYLELA